MPNVGISYDDAKQRELLEKYCKPKIFDALWKLGDSGDTDR